MVPSKNQFVSVIYDEIKTSLTTYIGECHEDVMVDSHKRSRQRGDSKLKFEVSQPTLPLVSAKQSSLSLIVMKVLL